MRAESRRCRWMQCEADLPQANLRARSARWARRTSQEGLAITRRVARTRRPSRRIVTASTDTARDRQSTSRA
eukprot:941689-Pyramimonas_sp.AAC.1